MLKGKTIPLTKKNTIGLKCGECLHFRQVPKYEKACEQLGVKRFADAPKCYSPNVYMLLRHNPDSLYQIGLLLHDFSAQETRVLLALLKSQTGSKKNYKLSFGQPVFFYLSRDYLNNYYRGYVVGTSNVGEPQVFVASSLDIQPRKTAMVGVFDRSSVFTVAEFKKHRQQLVNNGRIQDPKPLFADIPKVSADADHVPPSMEDAPAEWFASFDKRLKVKKSLKRGVDGSLEFNVQE